MRTHAAPLARRALRMTACVALMAGLMLPLGAAPAGASYGVGTDTGKIRLNDVLVAGASYRLPAFRIVNTGTQAAGYVMKVGGVKGEPSPKACWCEFKPDGFYLYPGQERSVVATLKLPGGATPAHYVAVLAAVPSLPGDNKGARVNVGVGPRLTMTVKSTSLIRRTYFAVSGWFSDHQPWSYGGAGLAVVVLATGAWWMAHRRRVRRWREEDEATEPLMHSAAVPPSPPVKPYRVYGADVSAAATDTRP